MSNTLPVHLEWRDDHPHAVIQPITGTELLTSLAWVDLVNRRQGKICSNPKCGIEYTLGGSKFCNEARERANRKREYRSRVKRAEAVIRANLGLPTGELLGKLQEVGIKRDENWASKTKADIRLERTTRTR